MLPRYDPDPEINCALVFSPDAKIIAGGLSDGSVQLWYASDGRPGPRLRGNRPRTSCLAFSPDGKILASGGADGMVRLWHLATGRELLSLTTCPGATVREIAFAPDGDSLAAAFCWNPELQMAGKGGVDLWRGRR